MADTAIKTYLKPVFIVCVAILLSAAVAKEWVIWKLGVHMVKEAISLQHPLDDMDVAALAPFELNKNDRIQNRDVVESLGTEEYLRWILEDTEAASNSPTRYCSLFITYYTGNPDRVPHVPDECYVGGGNTRESVATVAIKNARPDHKDLGFQYLVFSNIDRETMREEIFSVQYFFHANGEYSKNRTETRWILGSNWLSKYSYFCKVEWRFYGGDSYGRVNPDKEQTAVASEKLMKVLLPELEKNHWPDWEKINNESK